MALPSAALRRALLLWYRKSRRDLPWRRTRDPYRIWVSEIMLQQTRVGSVIPYFERFIARFPDVSALASADPDDVLSAWSGLGYYRRARLLHAAADEVVREHGGRFPRDPEIAQRLPGIGRSTAGSITSIAYGERAPVLDGNVRRVLSRLFGIRDRSAAAADRRLWSLARELADGDDPGDLNQALMELGATVCLPASGARCDACPVRSSCFAFARGLVALLPLARPKPPLVAETWAVAVVRRATRYLAHRRESGGLMPGLIELPTFPIPRRTGAPPPSLAATLSTALTARFGGRGSAGRELFAHRQVISNRRVTQRVFAATLRGRTGSRALWMTAAELRDAATTTATRRILERLAEDPGQPSSRLRPARSTAAASSAIRPVKR